MRLILGDCLEAMRELPDESIDAVVTDPPYGINFMGKAWDGRSIEEAAARPVKLDGVERLTGSPDSPSRKLTKRTGSAFANKAGEAGAYDFSPKGNRAFQAWTEQWAREAFRVLKPGGYLLSFAGTRTYHRMAAGVEDAGFEIRDQIAWMYGSGFPKSLDVSKAIDKVGGDPEILGEMARVLREAREARGFTLAQADVLFCGSSSAWSWYEGRIWHGERRIVPPSEERAAVIGEAWPETTEVFARMWQRGAFVGIHKHKRGGGQNDFGKVVGGEAVPRDVEEFALATDAATAWQGWGTALKPAFEPIVVARKPLTGTVAANVLEHGTGALNVDGCRIAGTVQAGAGTLHTFHGAEDGYEAGTGREYQNAGRWPANVVLDEEAAAVLDEQTGTLTSGGGPLRRGATTGTSIGGHGVYGMQSVVHDGSATIVGDSGGASRFFYVAKASRAERNAGLDGFEERGGGAYANGAGMPGRTLVGGEWRETPLEQRRARANHHPTVKPIALMCWLVRLITPPGGTVLDPFLGSGTTGIAAALEGFDFVGIEREPDYLPIAEARIAFWSEYGDDGLRIVAERDRSERERIAVKESGQTDIFAALDEAA